MKLTYKDAGVDKSKGYESVNLIKDLVKSTYNENVFSSLGGFSGMYDLSGLDYKQPVLVSGTDGVGTKVDLAFRYDKHDTIGIDAVAMCVNDILCQGARPLFFLDYIATGKIYPEKIQSIVSGVSDGCRQSKMALIGGETAEMPGIYKENDYDLAGFAVGIVEKDKIIDGSKVEPGDILIGLSSSGLHSNGFSLVRKIIFDIKNMDLNEELPSLDMKLGDLLLEPTKIYVNTVLKLLDEVDIHAISHITGGGFYENIPRVLKDNQNARIDLSNYQVPEVFNLIGEWGDLDKKEMYSTFNMGIGMVLVIDPKDEKKTLEILDGLEESYFILGQVVAGNKEVDLCNY